MSNEIELSTNEAENEAPKMQLPALPSQFDAEILEKHFKKVEDEVKGEILDVDTEDGRKRIKTIAADINKSKNVLDEPMRAHLRALKAIPKVLEKNARESKQRFESLRESVLEPLEEARKSQDELIVWLNNVPVNCSAPNVTSEQIKMYIADVEAIDHDLIWPELKKKFKVAIDNATTTSTVTLERVEHQEKQAAELEELRKKQAIAEQEEHDRKVAEAARIQAEKEAEAKAKAEKEAIERRAVEAKQREEKALADAEQAKREAEQAKIDAENEAIENEKRKEQALIDAKKREEEAAEKAAKDERIRLEEIEAQEKQDALDRENDKQHRAKINRSILVALIAEGFDEEMAKKFITVVAKQKLPDIKIMY